MDPPQTKEINKLTVCKMFGYKDPEDYYYKCSCAHKI
jgi:predicted alpha/beta-fold hydrolase